MRLPFSLRSYVARKGEQLVLHLPQARPSGCLIVDLRELPHVYFTVRHGEGGAVLGYANAQGDFTALAQFADAASAQKVLDQIVGRHFWLSDLMRFAAKVGVALLVFFLFVFALNQLLALITPVPSGRAFSGMNLPQAQAPIERPQAGVPVDADESMGK